MYRQRKQGGERVQRKKGSDVLSFFLSALVKTVGATIVSLHPTFSICGVGDRVYWRLLR
jgi:hypothetical protein